MNKAEKHGKELEKIVAKVLTQTIAHLERLGGFESEMTGRPVNNDLLKTIKLIKELKPKIELWTKTHPVLFEIARKK